MTQKVNPEIDTTLFVNISEKPFDIFIGGKNVRHLEAGEQQTLVLYVAEVGAKHLVDRILQETHGVKDTLRDTELRRSILAKIIPERAKANNVATLTPDQEKEATKKILAEQNALLETLKEKTKQDDARDKEIAELKNLVAQLVKEKTEKPVAKKPGRPAKVVAPEETTQA